MRRARPSKEEALSRWLQIEPPDFLRDQGKLVRLVREDGGVEQVHLGGIFSDSIDNHLGLDWEQPLIEREPRRVRPIPCFACGPAIWTPRWHPAWDLLQCHWCKRKWHCRSRRWTPTCPRCTPDPWHHIQELIQVECEIVNLICAKSLSVPKDWHVFDDHWEEVKEYCQQRFGRGDKRNKERNHGDPAK